MSELNEAVERTKAIVAAIRCALRGQPEWMQLVALGATAEVIIQQLDEAERYRTAVRFVRRLLSNLNDDEDDDNAAAA